MQGINLSGQDRIPSRALRWPLSPETPWYVMCVVNDKQICNIPTSTCWPDTKGDNDVRIIKIELKVFPISESWWSVYKSNYFYQWGPSLGSRGSIVVSTSDNLNKSSNYIFNSLYSHISLISLHSAYITSDNITYYRFECRNITISNLISGPNLDLTTWRNVWEILQIDNLSDIMQLSDLGN